MKKESNYEKTNSDVGNVDMGTAESTDAGTESKKPEIKLPSADDTLNGLGNTYLSDGYAVTDGEWLYFHHDVHYKMRLDGTDVEKLSIDDFGFIVSDGKFFDYKGSYASLLNGIMYYAGKDGIYKKNADETGETKILDGKDYSHVQVVGNWLFFRNKKTEVWYFCKTDGTGLKVAP